MPNTVTLEWELVTDQPTLLIMDLQFYSFMSTAYNVANAIFAGTAPLLQTSLVMNLHKYQVWQVQ